MNVYIARFSLPTSLDDVQEMIDRKERTDLEDVLAGDIDLEWSMPRSCFTRDVVFFQLGMKSPVQLRSLIWQSESVGEVALTRRLKGLVEPVTDSAGCLIACGRVGGRPFEDVPGSGHFRGRIFAPIENITPFEHRLRVVGSDLANIPVFAPAGPVTHRMFTSQDDYDLTRAAIRARGNRLPRWTGVRLTDFRECSPMEGLARATASDVGFFSEDHLCLHFAEPFCRAISDDNRVWRQVAVRHTRSELVGRRVVDFVITVDGVPVPVEAKLNVTAEHDLLKQVRAYTGPLSCRHGSIRHATVIVVDRAGVYLFQRGTWVGAPLEPALPRERLNTRNLSALRKRISELVAQD
jgi:hypothetical protein